MSAFVNIQDKENRTEMLKQHGVRLMDGTEDSLACCGELAQESNDVECRLTVLKWPNGMIRWDGPKINSGLLTKPDVGSSRKRRSWGLAASSTPIVRRFLASTPKKVNKSMGRN